jgi:hypothetical protein
VEPNERQRADGLDRSWDAVQGGAPLPHGDLDPVAAAVIRHLSEHQALPEREAVQLRLRQRIVGAATTQAETMPPATRSTDRLELSTLWGWPSPARRMTFSTRWQRMRRPFPSLATAALVLLTLVGSVIAFSGALRRSFPADAPARAPALVATPAASPTPAPFAVRGTLASGPAGPTWTGIERDVLDPGASVTLQTGAPTDAAVSAMFLVVEAGRLELRAGGAVAVRRAGAGDATTPVPAGTTVTLTADDAAVIAPGLSPIMLRNPGPDPAVTIKADVEPTGPGIFTPGFHFTNLVEQSNATRSAGGTIVLRRTTLAPNAAVPPPPAGVTQLATAPLGVHLGRASDGSYPNQTGQPLAVYVLTIEPASANAASATPAA